MELELNGTEFILKNDGNIEIKHSDNSDSKFTFDTKGNLQISGQELTFQAGDPIVYSGKSQSPSIWEDRYDDYTNSVFSGSEDVVFKNPFEFKYEKGIMIISRPMGNQCWHTNEPIKILKLPEFDKANFPTALRPGECGLILGLGKIFDVEIVFFSPDEDGKIDNFNTILKMMLKRNNEKWMTCFPEFWENRIDNLAEHFEDKTIEKHACKFIS